MKNIQIKYTDATIINFGAHKGKTLQDVPAEYLEWYWVNICKQAVLPGSLLSEYIFENLETINLEIKQRNKGKRR